MKKIGIDNSAIVLGGALVCLNAVVECTILAEAQDCVAEFDRRPLAQAHLTAKARGKHILAEAAINVLHLLNAVPYLQGDDQFAQYKASVTPTLQCLEQKLATER